MIKKISADQRYGADHGWLKTFHLFSFGDYYDPQNMALGNIRVFNDDTIATRSGFPPHSHDNMEIVTIVHRGQLSHTDSMGTQGVIKPGEVQYMSAGTGVTHSEMNDGDETVELYQIWIMPRVQNLTPRYEQKNFNELSSANQLIPVASGYSHGGAITIEANATIYTAQLESGAAFEHVLQANHAALLYVRDGEISINGITLVAGDQVRIAQETQLSFVCSSNAHIVFIETAL